MSKIEDLLALLRASTPGCVTCAKLHGAPRHCLHHMNDCNHAISSYAKRAQSELESHEALVEALKLADSTGALETYPKVEAAIRAALEKAGVK